MLSTIQNILQLKKELPDAVGYDTYGPISFPIPKELQNSIDIENAKLEFINITSIRIDNYSSKVQKDIRVLYSGGFLYEPVFKFRRRDVSVKFDINGDEKEIEIKEIPPNESVSIEIFYPSKGFDVIQVLSGENEITSLMQKLAEAKRYPEIARMKILTYTAAIAVLVLVATSGYFTWTKVKENNRINAAYSGFASCLPSIMENPPKNEKTLERKFNRLSSYWQNYILSSNKVFSLKELKLKDEVVWCEPKLP